MNTLERTGLLGGTFDPAHNGHVAIAETARRVFKLDRVLLVPARVPPHRLSAPVASASDRFAMVELAVKDHKGLAASNLELHDPAPTYTTETLQRLINAGQSTSQLFFITGADAFADITAWQGYPTLLDQSHFVVLSRPGHDLSTLRHKLPEIAHRFHEVSLGGFDCFPDDERTAIFTVEANTPDIASSVIRHRLSVDASVDDLVPSGVARYIHVHHLYGPAPRGKQFQ